MNPILKTHTRAEISQICKVCLKTVHNWLKLETIPLWAIKKLGHDIK